MDNLAIQELQSAGGPNHAAPPPGGPRSSPAGKLCIVLLALSKLTTQMFTTAAQLLDLTDSEPSYDKYKTED